MSDSPGRLKRGSTMRQRSKSRTGASVLSSDEEKSASRLISPLSCNTENRDSNKNQSRNHPNISFQGSDVLKDLQDGVSPNASMNKITEKDEDIILKTEAS